MRIYQDTYNKLITMMLLIFFMVMYVLSFIYNRPLDIIGAIAFIVPTVNNVAHIILQDRREIRENGLVSHGIKPLDEELV